MTKVERDFPFTILKELEANDVSNTFNVPKRLADRLKNFYGKPANNWLSLSGQFVTGIRVVYQPDGLLFNGADWEVVVGRYKLKEKHLMEFIDITGQVEEFGKAICFKMKMYHLKNDKLEEIRG